MKTYKIFDKTISYTNGYGIAEANHVFLKSFENEKFDIKVHGNSELVGPILRFSHRFNQIFQNNIVVLLRPKEDHDFYLHLKSNYDIIDRRFQTYYEFLSLERIFYAFNHHGLKYLRESYHKNTSIITFEMVS